MFILFLATAIVIVGCIWNGYELEKVVSHQAGGKQFGLGLTFVQCAFISVIAFSHCLGMRLYEIISFQLWARKSKGSRPSIAPAGRNESSKSSHAVDPADPMQRPLFTLSIKQAFWVALLFWLTNCINNAVFKFGIAVPIQQLVRSSSLLSSAVTGFYFDGKRFSFWQVLHLTVITGGIAVLSIVGTTSSSSSSSSSCGVGGCGPEAAAAVEAAVVPSSISPSYRLFPDPSDSEAVFLWICGVGLLLLSAFMATFLGMAQTNMYKAAEALNKGCSSLPGVTEEAIFTSHFLSLGFFALYYFIIESDANPVGTFIAMPNDLKGHIFLNCVSQYVCIWGVFALARTAGAFFLTMATTVRKFISLVLSVLYFGHAHAMTTEQMVAIAAVTLSVTVYPFLASPQNKVKVE